eukprot:sb/3474852/
MVVTESAQLCKLFYRHVGLHIQSDPDLPGPDLPEPRFTGRIHFPRYRKLTVFHPEISDTPIYRAKPFPPSIPVNRGPTSSIQARERERERVRERVRENALAGPIEIFKLRHDLCFGFSDNSCHLLLELHSID